MPIGKGTNMYAADGDLVKVAFTDSNGDATNIRCAVANLPSAVAGYAVSCIAQTTDGGIYQNTGTATSATFTLMDTAATSLQLPEAATDATTTTTTSLALTQNTVTSGTGLSQALNGLTTGKGHSITHTTAVIANGGSLLNVSSTSIDTSTTTGILANLSSTASTAGTQVLGTFSGLTTGIGASIVVDALTTGTALSLTNASGVMTTNGEMLLVSAPAATTSTGLVRVSGAGLTTGNVLQLNADQATLTTGRYVSANDGANEVFGIGANGHIHSTASADGPTIAVTQQNGISAAAITAGGTDTCGVITTTGTQDGSGDTILQVTFGKTYTTAPKAVMLFPLNSSASKVSTTTLVSPYISGTAATTFDITIPEDTAAGATPSFAYLVIA